MIALFLQIYRSIDHIFIVLCLLTSGKKHSKVKRYQTVFQNNKKKSARNVYSAEE